MRCSEKVKSVRTFGVGPCVAVCVYNPNNQIGALFHVDEVRGTDKRFRVPFEKSLEEIASQDLGDIVITLIGGNNPVTSVNTIDAIYGCIPEKTKVKHLLLVEQEIYNLVLDLNTGDVSRYLRSDTLSTENLNRLREAYNEFKKGNDLVRAF